MTAPELTLLDNSALALEATTETTVFNLNLSQFERVTVALKNTGGSNAVTAATWQRGAGALLANDAALATELVNNLGVGETAVVELSGDDVPSQLKCTLTSTVGTTVAVLITATHRASAIIPE